jgi:polyhydroxyalkanoate synthase
MIKRLWKSGEAIRNAARLEVGCTPRELVWSLNKTSLYRYVKGDAQNRPTLLLVYSLVNKPYVFDLRPGRSFVEFLVERGFDVFLLDWGSPGIEDKDCGIDEYVLEYLPRAVRAMKRASGSDGFFMMGYCIGAVLAMMYAAQQNDPALKGLVLLTAPVDFSTKEQGAFSHWLTEKNLDVDRLLRMVGNIPPDMVELGSKMLRPVDNYVGTYTGLLDKAEDESSVEGWQALYKWVHDGVPFTGEAFRQWVLYFIRENRFMSDALLMRGKQFLLSKITVPLLNVIAEHDHIVPPAQSLSFLERITSTDKETYKVAAGHVGLVIGRSAKQGLWPKVESWVKARQAPVASSQ